MCQHARDHFSSQPSPTTLKPVEMSNTDFRASVRHSAWNPWFLASTWRPADAKNTHPNTFANQAWHQYSQMTLVLPTGQYLLLHHQKKVRQGAWGIHVASKHTRSKSNWASTRRVDAWMPSGSAVGTRRGFLFVWSHVCAGYMGQTT